MSTGAVSATDPVERIATLFARPDASDDAVEEECESLAAGLGDPPSDGDVGRLARLVPLLRDRAHPRAAPLLRLIDAAAARAARPWPLLAGLLASSSPAVCAAALERLDRCVDAGSVALDRSTLRGLAALVDADDTPLTEPRALGRIASIVRRAPLGLRRAGRPALLGPYLDSPADELGRLAARLLDLDEELPRRATARRILGPETHRALAPYLDYTRAGHLDLLRLAPRGGGATPLAESLRAAEGACGAALLREIVARLGWTRINLGIEVRSRVGLSVDGSFPLLVAPGEAPWLERLLGARRAFDVKLVIAHGGNPPRAGAADRGAADRVARFRASNLRHAELLDRFLELAPLTRERVARILDGMDRIVEDFEALFGEEGQECAILAQVYRELERAVRERLDREGGEASTSPELVRLVLGFEDPASIGTASSLHGLKRYLHQRGLKLGMRLVQRGRPADRAVSLVLATPDRILRSLERIRYSEFDPPTASEAMPFPVALATEAFARQMLLGQEKFPHLDALCYGTEVHYYLAFWNHPALLRIAFDPPLRGGMIDLRYYGVSNYELETHPAQELEAIRAVLRRMDFDVRLDGALIHARFDKERAVDLASLHDRAELVLCLAPYLMDLDWIVGSLALDRDARRKVAEAWAERFVRWRALPVAELLTAERTGILLRTARGAAGARQEAWSGEGPYADRFGDAPRPAALAPALRALREAGIESPSRDAAAADPWLTQDSLERKLLRPLREAVAAGAVALTDEGPTATGPERFRREHEAERFAAILAGGGEALRRSAELARRVGAVERGLAFRTTGTLNGHAVEQAGLTLDGGDATLFVLRGPRGIARLAFYCRGGLLHLRRTSPTADWESNVSLEVDALTRRLRTAGYLSALDPPPAAIDPPELAAIAERFRRPGREPEASAEDLGMVRGVPVAPGRVVGRAVLAGAGLDPAQLVGAILLAETLTPDDGALIQAARGLLTTGGGALSHAGLLATQFGKPALIVSGSWERDTEHRASLTLLSRSWRERQRTVGGYRLGLRSDFDEQPVRVAEGDLLVLDAGGGTLRVLGQGPEALALHDDLRHLADATRRLDRALAEREILALRGRRLRAEHRLARLLARMADPTLARHATDELLLGWPVGGGPGEIEAKRRLLDVARSNPRVGPAVAARLSGIVDDLERQGARARAELEQRLAGATDWFEILDSRLRLERLRRAIDGARALARNAPSPPSPPDAPSAGDDLDRRIRVRLAAIRADAAAATTAAAAAADLPRWRHGLRRVERLDLVLGTTEERREALARSAAALRAAERSSRALATERWVLPMRAAAHEHHPSIGWKAANLAEVQRLAGLDRVPPWFVVTDRAFARVLDGPGPSSAPGSSLRQTIDALLLAPGLDDAQRSARILALWERVALPGAIEAAVREAYRELGGEAPPAEAPGAGEDGPFVAVRSSSREEDAEAAARAGEFETFLYVRGEAALLEHLRRAWAGLWTARAIHNRAVFGGGARATGGGVIVQRMVPARVSGVLQTIDVSRGESREMVIDAGLGLGEGVVRGIVGVDHFAVAKDDNLERGPLSFRCALGEKRAKVVFDRRAGTGTVRVETLTHERLRPALDYAELGRLARVAAGLERVYGIPLDLEFAIEDGRLWILQVRPVATHLAVLRATLEDHPLPAPRGGEGEWP